MRVLFGRRRATGEGEQVLAFQVAQPQRPGQGGEHLVGRVGALPLFEADVVRHAHPGELRQLLAAQPGHAAALPVGDETDVVRPQTGAA
jgi:hypothetical protein